MLCGRALTISCGTYGHSFRGLVTLFKGLVPDLDHIMAPLKGRRDTFLVIDLRGCGVGLIASFGFLLEVNVQINAMFIGQGVTYVFSTNGLGLGLNEYGTCCVASGFLI